MLGEMCPEIELLDLDDKKHGLNSDGKRLTILVFHRHLG